MKCATFIWFLVAIKRVIFKRLFDCVCVREKESERWRRKDGYIEIQEKRDASVICNRSEQSNIYSIPVNFLSYLV